MTAENPEGWKLEELLEQLVVEVEAKTAKIEGVDAVAAGYYCEANAELVVSFTRLAALQKRAIEFAKANPFTI